MEPRQRRMRCTPKTGQKGRIAPGIIGRIVLLAAASSAANRVGRSGNQEDGGEDGIRTHETLLRSTPLAGERLRPLGHLSGTGEIAGKARQFKRFAGTRPDFQRIALPDRVKWRVGAPLSADECGRTEARIGHASAHWQRIPCRIRQSLGKGE